MLIIIICAIIAVVIIAVLVSMNIQSSSARKNADAEKVESKDLTTDRDPGHESAPAAEVEQTEEAVPHSRMEKRKSRSKIDDDSYRNALHKMKKTETASEKEHKAGDDFYRNALKSINDKKDK